MYMYIHNNRYMKRPGIRTFHPNTTDLLTRSYSFVPDARKTDQLQIHSGPSDSSTVCIFGGLLRVSMYPAFGLDIHAWQLRRQRHFLLVSY